MCNLFIHFGIDDPDVGLLALHTLSQNSRNKRGTVPVMHRGLFLFCECTWKAVEGNVACCLRMIRCKVWKAVFFSKRARRRLTPKTYDIGLHLHLHMKGCWTSGCVGSHIFQKDNGGSKAYRAPAQAFDWVFSMQGKWMWRVYLYLSASTHCCGWIGPFHCH